MKTSYRAYGFAHLDGRVAPDVALTGVTEEMFDAGPAGIPVPRTGPICLPMMIGDRSTIPIPGEQVKAGSDPYAAATADCNAENITESDGPLYVGVAGAGVDAVVVVAVGVVVLVVVAAAAVEAGSIEQGKPVAPATQLVCHHCHAK